MEKNAKLAINFFESNLKRIKSSNLEEGKEYYIFFPSFLVLGKVFKAKIPIFEKIDENKSKLVYWKKFDLNKFSSSMEQEKNQIIIDTILDYNDSKYEKDLEDIYKIFKGSNNAKDKNTPEILEELKIIAKEFNERLTQNLGDIYNTIYNNKGIDKTENKTEDKNNKQDEKLDDKSNNEQENKQEENQKETEVEVNKVNKNEDKEEVPNKDVSDSEIVLEEKKKLTAQEWYEKFASLTNIERKKYEFEMKCDGGLRFTSDRMLEIAYNMLKHSKTQTLKFVDEKKFVFKLNVKAICNKNITMEELEEGVKDENGSFFPKGTIDYNLNKNTDINYVCKGCTFEKCPKAIAMYIVYLINKGNLLEKLVDRETYRRNEFESDFFTFRWEPEDGLKKIPEKIYKFSEELVNREIINVNNSLDNGMVVMNTDITCKDFKVTEGDINKLPTELPKQYNTWLKRNTTQKILFCKGFECALEGCPIFVAGYIYYLRLTGNQKQIDADREFYKQHKEECDKEYYEAKQDKLNSKIEYAEEIKNSYKNKINHIEDLVDMLTNRTQTQLHCIIEGNDAIIKKDCFNKIADVLKDLGKINSNTPVYMSLQNLASSQAYSYVGKIDPEKKDLKGVPYNTQNAIKYTELPENQLFILNGVSEFVSDYNAYRNPFNNSYAEIRKKQFEHAIDILTNITYKNYIIIDSTEKETDSLFELNSKLQFTFQNSRFKTAELTIDELFDLYKKEIKTDLIGELGKDSEKYKKEFKEYISLNKSFLPFSQRELVTYLASYSNSKDKIVFPENIYKKETVEESLKNIIGLDGVKSKVKEFEKYMLFQVKAQSLGLKLSSTNMHMIFTGNPGTGKTTVARIMAKMLFDLGLIKENKLVEVERKDLVAAYIGQTAPKTTEVIERAMGGVLFIDEAYTLAQKTGSATDFGAEAIATLIKAMEDRKGDFVVIFAGYKDEMQTFLEVNPGISSRIGYTFDFPDYTVEELVKIFNLKVTNMGLKCENDIEKELTSICEYYTKKKAFGNGRFVDKLVQETIMKHALSDDDDITLLRKKDIPTIEELNNTTKNYNDVSVDKMLENIVGMKELKEKIKEFGKYVNFIKEAENNKITIPNQNLHMIFTGNPGTGKTTIARIMAKMLFELGAIHENKLIEVERKDLVASYIGQTAPKTSEVIEKAMGGVLFIDEAYTLAQGGSTDFGSEAVATLIKAMEDHKGEFVVIFAGYKEEMGDFLKINPGIASRIGYIFDFPDYTSDEFCEILYRKIESSGLKLDKKAKEPIEKIMKYFCNVENIGNGRFVDKVFQEILVKHAKGSLENIVTITKEDIPSVTDITKSLYNGNNMIDPSKITGESKKRTAIHEIGHAATRYLLFTTPGIKKITINAEGTGTLGYVLHEVSREGNRSKSDFLKEITVLMAGMASEQYFLGEFQCGNFSDLDKATTIAKRMITMFGMSSLGFGRIYETNGVLAKNVQDEINKILQECFDRAIKLIEENETPTKAAIDYLLENNEINEEMFVEKFEGGKSKATKGKSTSKTESKEAKSKESKPKENNTKTKSTKSSKDNSKTTKGKNSSKK